MPAVDSRTVPTTHTKQINATKKHRKSNKGGSESLHPIKVAPDYSQMTGKCARQRANPTVHNRKGRHCSHNWKPAYTVLALFLSAKCHKAEEHESKPSMLFIVCCFIVCVHITVYPWKSECNLLELVLSFHYVSPEIQVRSSELVASTF